MESNINTGDDNQKDDIIEEMHRLEKQCIGYDNYVNCDDEHYLKTLESLRKIIQRIQRESVFSPNEEIKEIHTENLKLLMAPFYQADLLFRIMDQRSERVKMAQIFFMEYLKLLDHYGVLEKDQYKTLKSLVQQHKVKIIKNKVDATVEEVKEAKQMLDEIQEAKLNPYDSRDAKIAEFKMKKAIGDQLDMLKNYQDEETKREYYMAFIRRSVLVCFEQLRMVDMELDILKHQAQLTPEQIEANKAKSSKPEPGSLPPLQMETITKESFQQTPYLMRPDNVYDDGSAKNHGVVNQYEHESTQRVIINQETVDGRIAIEQQYKNQVFRPGHNLPTETLEALADREVADALRRQAQDKEHEYKASMEDPESQEILERERIKERDLEDWKDFVPKGQGVTQRI